MLQHLRIAHAPRLYALPDTLLQGLFQGLDPTNAAAAFAQPLPSSASPDVLAAIFGGSESGGGAGGLPASGGTAADTSIVLESLGLSSLSVLTPRNGAALHIKRVEVSCMPSLVRIPAGGFDAVARGGGTTSLKLNSNGITAIAPQAFVGLSRLITLEIQGNARLERLSGGEFDGVFDRDADVHLNLVSNGLRFISPEAITFRSHRMSAPPRTIVTASSFPGTHLDVCCSYEWLVLDPHWVLNGLECANTFAPNTSAVEAVKAVKAEDRGSGGSGGSGDAVGVEIVAERFSTAINDITDVAHSSFGCCFQRGWQDNVIAINSVGNLGSFAELPANVQSHLHTFCANASWSTASDASGDPPVLLGPDRASALPDDCGANYDAASHAGHGCLHLNVDFQTTWVPSAFECVPNLRGCPDGMRQDLIGRRHLVDCEPWMHAARTYETVFAVAERQCVECAVPHCSVCDGGEFRVCSKCKEGFSLYQGVSDDGGSLEHICTERCAQFDHYSSNDSSVGVQMCVKSTTCGDGENEIAGLTEEMDRTCEVKKQLNAAVIGGVVAASAFILLLAAAIVRYSVKRATLPTENL